ncbi:unnamed protein product [Prorocentrum cordatum]|uniref:Alpha-galactosidase n=1 Tax=Prorocentrum cordatum TaxID=2364126 RepID=A0ABN9VNN9_9DINO|nr:unnamed protein product [Polarella glacialis]
MTALRTLPVFWAAFHFVGAPGKLSGGVARPQSPPMGWRSWNVFQCSVSQEIIEQQMDALMAKRAVDGVQTSLLDLGYSDLGLDDCWQVCDAKGESFHDPDTGMAIINTELFPDMEGMVSYGHMRGLQVGFYVNNCFCHEHGQPTHYAEDANLTVKLGYDSVKIDSCGNQRDMTEWLREFESLGKTLMVESCGNGPPGSQPKHDAIPSTAWLEMINNTCPFSFYRVSDDIAPQFLSTMYNLNRLVPYLGASPLSRPGCWAYPDMLEVGVRLSEAEARTHFAAWCVTSSPLILGFDLSDSQKVDAVWHIIANREALGVSQTWAGHPGRLVANSSRYFEAVCEIGAAGAVTAPCTIHARVAGVGQATAGGRGGGTARQHRRGARQHHGRARRARPAGTRRLPRPLGARRVRCRRGGAPSCSGAAPRWRLRPPHALRGAVCCSGTSRGPA